MQAPDSLCLELHVHPRKKFQSDAKEHCFTTLAFSFI